MDQCNVANLVTFAFVVNDDLFVLIFVFFFFFFLIYTNSLTYNTLLLHEITVQ